MCSLSAGSRGPSTLRAILRRSRCPRRLGTGAGASASMGAAAPGGGRNDLSASVADPETKPTDRQGGGSPVVRTVIEPKRGFSALRLKEVWNYRELLYFLTWRDIKVRYKQTVLGVAWAVLAAPADDGRLHHRLRQVAGRPGPGSVSGGAVPVFSYTGLLPWALLRRVRCTQAGSSLVGSSSLLTKVYFPRLVIPMAGVLGGLLDFVISFVVLGGLMAYLRRGPHLERGLAAGLRAAGPGHGAGVRAVALGAQRAVPRRRLHHPLPHPALDVRHARSPTRSAHPSRALARASTGSTRWPA